MRRASRRAQADPILNRNTLWEKQMYGMYWLGGGVALLLFVYLVMALVRAEDF